MTAGLYSSVLAAALVCVQAAQPTFRSGTDAIAVPVAVFDGDQVVRSLTAADFQIRDNGIPQVVTAADFNTLPIDLRLVFDTSGSISAKDLADFLRTMRQVASTLEPRDRCEILTFSSRIAEAAAQQCAKIELQRPAVDGTAFFDAVSLALVTVPTPDRRQITIVLSDARDNASFFDETAMLDTARVADSVVYTILPGDPRVSRAMSVARLQALSLLTGGRLVRAPQHTISNVIIDALTEFRQSYVVRYTLSGAKIDGWHKLDVRVRGGKYRVRTRPGYFGR